MVESCMAPTVEHVVSLCASFMKRRPRPRGQTPLVCMKQMKQDWALGEVLCRPMPYRFTERQTQAAPVPNELTPMMQATDGELSISSGP